MAGVAGWMAVMPIDLGKSIIQVGPYLPTYQRSRQLTRNGINRMPVNTAWSETGRCQSTNAILCKRLIRSNNKIIRKRTQTKSNRPRPTPNA